ncbi:UNVERIFIED_ORG: hypothetical protein FHU01_4490 [Citrobacter freundii]
MFCEILTENIIAFIIDMLFGIVFFVITFVGMLFITAL